MPPLQDPRPLPNPVGIEPETTVEFRIRDHIVRNECSRPQYLHTQQRIRTLTVEDMLAGSWGTVSHEEFTTPLDDFNV